MAQHQSDTIPDNANSKIRISDLIEDAKKALEKRDDYADRVVKCIHTTWNQFLAYCQENGFDMFHSDLVESFLSEKDTFKPSTIQRKRGHLKILVIYAKTGTWNKGHLYTKPDLSVEFSSFIDAQDRYLKKYEFSENTRITVEKQSYTILGFFYSCGVNTMEEINISHITSYTMACKGHARSTLRCELSRLRGMLHNAYLLEYTKDDKSPLVPRYNFGQPQSRVKIWNQGDLDKVLATVDPTSPKGKRDAAFITIASELGMRSKEICDLKLSDFDWEACTVSFTQCKTGHPNVLPINEKTGEAIINYLHVRPKTDCEYLFVNLNPPYDKMKSFNAAFGKYVRRSGVTIPRDSHYGLHSQRATVITRLLEAGVSADDAFSFVGHSNRDSLHNYARLDIEHLRECALSFIDGDLI